MPIPKQTAKCLEAAVKSLEKAIKPRRLRDYHVPVIRGWKREIEKFLLAYKQEGDNESV